MRRALQTLEPTKNPDMTPAGRKLARDAMLQSRAQQAKPELRNRVKDVTTATPGPKASPKRVKHENFFVAKKRDSESARRGSSA